LGFLDKMKSAAQTVTGGAAKVSIEYAHQPMKSGDSLQVKVTVVSMGKEVKSKGVFVDIHASEQGQVKCNHCQQMVNINHETVKQSIPIGPAFVLQPNESKTFEGTISLPMGQPTYNGQVRHTWMIRGRLDAFGNDPDSGFQNLEVR
jgi:sporulation-control protein spo0M